MMRRLLAALALWPALAFAGDLPTIAPTPPATTNNNQIATTAWVNNFLGTAAPLASGKIWIGSAGNIATPQTMSADATLSILGALTLATVNANVGSFGSATQCPTLTVNGKGLVTAASAATCTPAIGSITGLGTGVATALGVALNGSGGVIGPTPTRAGDVAYWNGSAWTSLAGNNSGTNCFSENSSGVPSWAACSGGGGGTPGGSNTQVQYNNAGAFGGITGATTNGTALTLVAPILGTPASATLTNATGLPISTGVSGLAAGIATWLATSSSANLRAALTDESGTGAAYFQGGDIGTPSAGVLTNATGLPISTGVSGLGTGCATFLGTPSSANLRGCLTDEVGTGAAYFVGGALGTPASGTATNLTGLPISTGVSGLGSGVATALGNATNAAGGVVTSPVANANLANSATTVAGQTCSLGSTCGLSSTSNNVTVAVNLSNVTYADGPSVAQGATGTWLATGNATISATSGDAITCKLWDGTNLIDSNQFQVGSSGAASGALSGISVSNPPGNLRISCLNVTALRGTIATNNGVDQKASTISAVRIN